MPIIKSAKKRMRQNEVRRKRNYMMRSTLKTHVKKAFMAIKEGDKKKAEDAVRVAYSVIDTAAKKNILHKNNAARKKSQLATKLNELQSGGATAAPKKKVAAKKESAKKETTKKVEKKEEEKKEEDK